MHSKTITVPNISCEHCVNTVETELLGLGGVIDVEADAATKAVQIDWDAPANWEKISALLTDIGYPAAAG